MRFLFIFTLFFFAWASLLRASSVVILDSGEQVIGEMISEANAEVIVLKSELLGVVNLPRERIATIEHRPEIEQPDPVETVQETPKKKPFSELEAAPELEVALEEQKVVEALKTFKSPDTWSGNLRLGLNLSRGDRRWAETFSRGQLEVKPKQSPHFFRYSGSYTYRESERSDGSQIKSTDKYDLEFIYRRSFFQNWFIQNSLAGRVDQIKGIDRELQETLGVGYTFKPSDRFELIIGGGGGIEDFQATYEDTRVGLNPLLNVFQEASWHPLERTSLVQKLNYNWNPEDAGQFSYVLSAAVRVRLTDLLGLEFSFNKSFDNDVGDGSARDDVQWRNALVVYF